MQVPDKFLFDVIATLIGVLVGTLVALGLDQYNQRRIMKKRARIVLHSLLHELHENVETLKSVESAFRSTPWGKSLYISTISWETAISSGDLPDIIGFEMADKISYQYALLYRIKYYVDLLTRLWFAPADIPGYDEKRKGFNQAIVDAMDKVTGNRHLELKKRIEAALKGD